MPKNKHIDNIELRSEEVQEILTKVPHWMIRWGNTLFFVILLLLFQLSWVIKYPDIISSKAILTTKITPQKEYARITGEIDTIYVKNNQNVGRKTTIAIIENTANYKDVFFLKSIIDTIHLRKKDFIFPINKIPILFLGDIEDAYSNFENNYMLYILNKNFKPFSNEAIAKRVTNSELHNRLQYLKSQKKNNLEELNLKKKDLKRSKSLISNGVISAREYEKQEISYLQAERNYQNMNTSISQQRELISNSNMSIKGGQIEHIKNDMILLKNTFQAFNQLKKAIKDWELRYTFVSKINGKVSFLKYWNKNQTVKQGDLVFMLIRIFPLSSSIDEKLLQSIVYQIDYLYIFY